MKKKRPRIIVEISGGVASIAHSDVPVNIAVLDWDEYRVGTPTERRRIKALEAETIDLPHAQNI